MVRWAGVALLLAAGVVAYLLLDATDDEGGRRTEPRSDPVPPGARVLRVLGPFDRPVAGAGVRLFAVSPYRLEPREIGLGSSSDDGWVTLPPSPALDPEEALTAVVRAEGMADASLPVTPGTEVLVLQAGREVAGLVVDLDGRPLAGARVLHPSGAPFTAETRTDAEGRFRIGPVADDAWLRAEADGFAPLDLNLALYPMSGMDLVFYLVPERRVSGQVVDSGGRGLPGTIVTLDQETVSRVATDAEGRFELRGVLPDWEALVTARHPDLIGETGTAVAGEEGFRLTLHRPAEVQGTVVDGRTDAPVTGFEFAGMDHEETGDGGFRVLGLLPGRTRLEVRTDYLFGEAVLDVAEGDVRRGLRIALFPHLWGPSGSTDHPVPVSITVLDAESGEPCSGVEARGSSQNERARTDARGKLEIAVRPGRCWVRFGGHFAEHAFEQVLLDIPAQREHTIRLRRNPRAVLELREGRAELGSKLWLVCGREFLELDPLGKELEFHAPYGIAFEFMLRAKGYLPERERVEKLPEDGRIPVLLIRGAMIRGRCIGAGDHPMPKVVAEVEEKPLEARMETLGDGTFRVGPLRPGRYTLLLYARNVRARKLEVDLGAVGVDLGDIEMPPPGALRVRVVTSDGRPVPGADVETSILVAAKGRTDAAGLIVLPAKNEQEVLRVQAPGYLVAWQGVSHPLSLASQDILIEVHRPARVIVRTVDDSGRPVPALVPAGENARKTEPGEIVFERVPPGPLIVELRDGDGRSGRLEIVVREGEERVERVVLR